MATQQQTVLRVETNIQPDIAISGNTSVSVTSTDNMTVTGSGTTLNPFTGVTTSTATTNLSTISFTVTGGSGTLYYNIRVSEGDVGFQYVQNSIRCFVTHANGYNSGNQGFNEYNTQAESATDAFLVRDFKVLEGDVATFQMWPGPSTGTSRIFAYVVADNEVAPPAIKTFDSLDIYGDIPIKLNKSFAEIQDISKRNSDYSLGIQLPGSKKNNRFFESYFNVDTDSLYFDVTKRVPCQILINDERYFEGYMRLNKVNVINTKVEYDVTLYSIVADLFGKIGNNLLNDLDFNDIDFHFNHQFSLLNTMFSWRFNALTTTRTVPALWMYPIVHNGYNYTGDTTNNDSIVDVSGTTQATTRLYTSTVASGYTNYAAFTSAGGLEYRINSPKSPVIDNQLKPGLSIWGLIQLMFKTYGYKIKSDFFNTPWFKLLYVYGVYGSDTTKFSRKLTTIEQFPLDGVDVIGNFERFVFGSSSNFYVVKKGTGIPCYCTEAISFRVILINLIGQQTSQYTVNIPALTTGTTMNLPGGSPWLIRLVPGSSNVTTSNRAMTYFPQPVGTVLPILDGDNVNFSEIIDNVHKQIDILSSIAKKFDLVFIPDPDVPNQIIIEPYDYYVATGEVHDWTDKLSYDKGFTIQPALNFIESEIILTDLEDGDDGNKIFKDRNNRIYGENKVTNPTDFKSQTKKIDTIFSPELIRKWDDRVSIPLGINYASQNKPSESGNKQKVTWEYKGIKSKPKLFFFQGIFSPFIDQVGEYYDFGSSWRVNTTYFRLQKSNRTNYAGSEYALGSLGNPIVSHTMPMGNPDSNKNDRGFNNDSLCILFNSEEPGDIGLGIPTFNTYTENDAYSSFYSNRINNVYNKNTRFLSGQFDLKLSDIKNLKYDDLIKIKDQYFTVNKISNYNYTNPELTNVELIQSNIEPKSYPDRYFFYQYCSGSTTTYKFKTYFNPEENDGAEYYEELPNSMRKTYFFWAVLYDYMVGALGGNVTGFTSSITSSLNSRVYPYNISEVTKDEYESTGVSHVYDPNNLYFIDRVNNFPSTFVTEENDYVYVFANSGITQSSVMFNVGLNCTLFNQTAQSAQVVLSPGGTTLPTPTPTATATPQPTPTVGAMRGSLIMSFDELVPDRGIDNYTVVVNNQDRDVHFTEIDSLYSTNLNLGDVVTITIQKDITSSTASSISVSRRDYTTDDQGGDMGIKQTYIGGASSTGTTSYTFTATTMADAYSFAYVINVSEYETMATNGGFSGRSFSPLVGLAFDAEILSTGKILIGHRYATYGGTPVKTVTQLLNDGTLDTSFITTGITNNIQSYDIKEQSDGKLLIAGNAFGSFNLLRLNANGSTDTSFNITSFFGGTSFNEERIELQSDGKIIFGNDFGASGVISGYTGLVRFNTNGTVDTTFNSGGSQWTGGNGDKVLDVYVYPDDKILVAGQFSKYNGVSCNSLIRLNADGTVDPTFNLDPYTGATDTYFNDIEVLSDGRILVAGDPFSNPQYLGVSVGAMFGLNTDGTFNYDFPYNQFATGTFSPSINDIYEMTDGSILVGGGFEFYSGTAVNNLIKLNSNGTLNTAFTPPAINGAITDIEITTNGGVLCTGTMTTLGTQTSGGLIKVNPVDGSSLIT